MDRDRFDTLTRAFARRTTRRVTLGALLGLGLLGRGRDSLAKPGKAKGKGHSTSPGKGHDKGKGCGHQNDKICAELSCEKVPVPVGEDREFCCKGGFCSCGGDCCEDACFQTGTEESPNRVFCCTGRNLVICRVPTGVPGEFRDTCCKGSCDACDAPGQTGIAGSYRRPR
jgi:hypothetical protein